MDDQKKQSHFFNLSKSNYMNTIKTTKEGLGLNANLPLFPDIFTNIL